jgi:hypothetical protein
MTAAALQPVTPVQCTPWCGDGTGHPDAEVPDDQGCYSGVRRVDLVRNLVPGQGVPSNAHVMVHLYRDAYPDGMGGAFLEPPHIEVHGDDVDPLRLSPAEARELSAVLAELADAAQPR